MGVGVLSLKTVTVGVILVESQPPRDGDESRSVADRGNSGGDEGVYDALTEAGSLVIAGGFGSIRIDPGMNDNSLCAPGLPECTSISQTREMNGAFWLRKTTS